MFSVKKWEDLVPKILPKTLFCSLHFLHQKIFQLKENQWKSHWKTHFCDPLKHKEKQKTFPPHLVGNLDARDRKLRSCVRGRRRLYFSPALTSHSYYKQFRIYASIKSPRWLCQNIEIITLWTVFSLRPNISVTLN